MGLYDGLEGEIRRFESINRNREDDYYEEDKSYWNHYDKNDVLKVIKEYGKDLFVTYTDGETKHSILDRFINAIKSYLKNEEILVELFKINGKATLDAISSNTDLLKDNETKIFIYRVGLKRK